MLARELVKLSDQTVGYIDTKTSIGSMELGYLKQVLHLCLELLKFVISVKRRQQEAVKPKGKTGEMLVKKGNRVRKYLSLFGVLEFSRPSYYSKASGMHYELDRALSMPKGLWSYNIQNWVGSQSSYENYRQSVSLINKVLDLGLSDMGSNRNALNLGERVDAYYEQKSVEAPKVSEQEVVCFSASFDGKGVPKIKRIDKTKPRQTTRLKKGEKRGVKQMATVGVMSYFTPKIRSAEQIVQGLMSYGKVIEKTDALAENRPVKPPDRQNDNTWHQGIHRRAFLADQQKSIDYGIGYIKQRIKDPKNKFVVPIDAGIGLEEKVLQAVKAYDLEHHFDGIILDIVHVSEYVWDCANAILGDQSQRRAEWVKKQLLDLLDSKTDQVIERLNKNMERKSLTKAKREKIQKAITYFENHQHKMDYKAFLEKGYPVSSALVEANCKHLVKDRMELSGMRWSSPGAQNMMDLRAVNLNDHMDDFMDFVKQQEQYHYEHAA